MVEFTGLQSQKLGWWMCVEWYTNNIFSLTMDRMFSGWWPSPNCLSSWRVYSQLRTVSTTKFLKIHILKKFRAACLWRSDHYCSCSGIAARLAVQAGAAGIIVSNHGARQLDYVPATIMALEEVLSWNDSLYYLLPNQITGHSHKSLYVNLSFTITSGCESCTRSCTCILRWRCPTRHWRLQSISTWSFWHFCKYTNTFLETFSAFILY